MTRTLALTVCSLACSVGTLTACVFSPAPERPSVLLGLAVFAGSVVAPAGLLIGAARADELGA